MAVLSGYCRVWLLRILALAVFSAPLPEALAQGLENRVKAAYLVNFTRFVAWPSEVASRLEICVAGSQGTYWALVKLLDTKGQAGRAFSARFVLRPDKASGCSAVYLASNDPDLQRYWLRQLPQSATLTVSDDAGFIDAGGMIGFLLIDGKLRFDINQAAINERGLSVSSKLLNLAHRVQRPKQEGRR